MTVGRVVDYDSATSTYRLPPEHAAFLIRAAGPNNMAVMAQLESLLGSVEDDIVACFSHGGGVPYSRFPRFQQLMAEDSAKIHDASLIESILPLADGLVDRMKSGSCGSERLV
jgi:hypothetical protein